MTAAEMAERLGKIQRRLINGCGNHGCIIKAPVGMAANGPCRCRPWAVKRELQGYLRYVPDNGDWEREMEEAK